MIRTKLHLLADYTITQTTSYEHEKYKSKLGGVHPILQKMMGAASYVIDHAVLELLTRADVGKSIAAVIEAGIARLPVSPMLIEFSPMQGYTDFVLLEEDPVEKPDQLATSLNVWVGVMYPDNSAIIYDYSLPYGIGKDTLTIPDIQMTYTFAELANLTPAKKNEIESTDAQVKNFIQSGIIALELAFLMLNTKGIEKQVIEVPNLNKARIRKGRTPIQRHSIIHIGTIYRRDGSAIRGDFGATGRHMPMHLRQAHTRRQHYGPREDGNTKLIFVPACIVNFVPDENLAPTHRTIAV